MTTNSQTHVLIQDMQHLRAVQPESIISRTVYSDSQINVVVFGFDAGQSLSDHAATQAATIQILQGEATVTLAGETIEANSDTWIHMPPNTVHSVVAKTPLILLLTLLKTPSARPT